MHDDFYFPVVRVPHLSEICEAAAELGKSVRHHLCKPSFKGLPPSCTGQGYFEILEAAERLEVALNPRRLAWDDNNRICLIANEWPASVGSSLGDIRRHFDNVLQTLGWHKAVPAADYRLMQYRALPMHGTIDWPSTPVDEDDLAAIDTAIGRVREALASFPQCVYRVDPLWAHLERVIGCLIDHPRVVLFEKEPSCEKGLNVVRVNRVAEEYLGPGRQVFEVRGQSDGQAVLPRSLLVYHPAPKVSPVAWTIGPQGGLHGTANGTDFGAKVHRTVGHLRAWQAVRERQLVVAINPPQSEAPEPQQAQLVPAAPTGPTSGKKNRGRKRSSLDYLSLIVPLKNQNPNLSLAQVAARIGVRHSTLYRLSERDESFKRAWDKLEDKRDRTEAQVKKVAQRSHRVAGDRARRDREEENY